MTKRWDADLMRIAPPGPHPHRSYRYLVLVDGDHVLSIGNRKAASQRAIEISTTRNGWKKIDVVDSWGRYLRFTIRGSV